MKNFYTIALFFTLPFLGHAQLDTIFQSAAIEYAYFEPQQLVDAKKHYLQLQQDETHSWKFGFETVVLPSVQDPFSPPQLSLANGLFIAYEYRFKTGFSLNTQLQYSRATSLTLEQILLIPNISIYIMHNYGFHIEPRWYFQKQKEINAQKSGDNLNGIYLSLLAGIRYWQKPDIINFDGSISFFKGQYQHSTLNLGWQRRFGKRGFLHLQIGTGIQHIPQKVIESNTSPLFDSRLETIANWQWISNYKVGIGLTLGKRNDIGIKSNILNYHQVDTDIWKIDLLGLLTTLGKGWVGGKINIGYEKSIQQSSFSITTNLLYFNLSSPQDYYDLNQLSLQVAPRYYYNLKSRIQKGKTANNLSADYFSFRNELNVLGNGSLWDNQYTFSLLWGLQRRVFENMFINYELGYDFPFRNQFSGEVISELKIGLAF